MRCDATLCDTSTITGVPVLASTWLRLILRETIRVTHLHKLCGRIMFGLTNSQTELNFLVRSEFSPLRRVFLYKSGEVHIHRFQTHIKFAIRLFPLSVRGPKAPKCVTVKVSFPKSSGRSAVAHETWESSHERNNFNGAGNRAKLQATNLRSNS